MLYLALMPVLMPEIVLARERMAVLDLKASEFDATEALLLSERLRFELNRMRRYELVERSDLYALADELGLDPGACDERCLATLGKALEVRWVVAGNIQRLGDSVRIEALLFDVSRQFAFSRIAREPRYDIGRLREKEMRRLAEELVPPQEGSAVPWWLLVLGAGGGAAWWATQGAGAGGGVTGSADVVGTFPDP